MRVRIRLLLIVGAAILVFAGTVAGWLIALSRGRSMSDAIVSAILTGVFTLLGEGIGLVVPMIQEWERTPQVPSLISLSSRITGNSNAFIGAKTP